MSRHIESYWFLLILKSFFSEHSIFSTRTYHISYYNIHQISPSLDLISPGRPKNACSASSSAATPGRSFRSTRWPRKFFRQTPEILVPGKHINSWIPSSWFVQVDGSFSSAWAVFQVLLICFRIFKIRDFPPTARNHDSWCSFRVLFRKKKINPRWIFPNPKKKWKVHPGKKKSRESPRFPYHPELDSRWPKSKINNRDSNFSKPSGLSFTREGGWIFREGSCIKLQNPKWFSYGSQGSDPKWGGKTRKTVNLIIRKKSASGRLSMTASILIKLCVKQSAGLAALLRDWVRSPSSSKLLLAGSTRKLKPFISHLCRCSTSKTIIIARHLHPSTCS